jgi:hypothetical protein
MPSVKQSEAMKEVCARNEVRPNKKPTAVTQKPDLAADKTDFYLRATSTHDVVASGSPAGFVQDSLK